MNILISGSSGFIGEHITRYMLKNTKFNLILIVNKKIPKIKKTNRISYVYLKRQNIEKIKLKKKISSIIHCAGLAHVSNKIPFKNYYYSNVELTRKLLNFAKNSKIQLFINLSSIKVYGNYSKNLSSFKESSILNPLDNYSISKQKAEEIVKSFSLNEYLSCLNLRLPLMYGNNLKGNLGLLEKIINFMPIMPIINFKNNRSLLHVYNLCEFILFYIELKNKLKFENLNITDDKNYSTQEIIKSICNLKKKKFLKFDLLSNILAILCKMIMPNLYQKIFGSFCVSNNKIKSNYKWKPKYSLNKL